MARIGEATRSGLAKSTPANRGYPGKPAAAPGITVTS
jgi:hypothetical protein